MPTCPLPYRYSDECKNVRCARFTVGYVYGLLDARIGDIFYVGSTVKRPSHRYSKHMQAWRSDNFREAWILAILADGSLPVFLSLGEFATECEQELHQIEQAIAEDLRAQGHTALSDDGRRDMLTHRLPATMPSAFTNERWILLENAIAEHLDRVNEQARTVQWLRDF